MNLTQIFSRLAPRFIPRQFGLLTGIFCIIGLFSALQLSSSFLLTASLNEAQRNEQRNQLASAAAEQAGSGPYFSAGRKRSAQPLRRVLYAG